MVRYGSFDSVKFSSVVLLSICMTCLCLAENDNGESFTDHSPKIREKRVSGYVKMLAELAKQGRRAIQKIEEGAILKKVSEASREPNRLFEKAGNYDTAIKDFESVVPDVSAVTETARNGRVGDRKVKLRLHGYKDKPTLYVIRKGKGYPTKTDVFVYKN